MPQHTPTRSAPRTLLLIPLLLAACDDTAGPPPAVARVEITTDAPVLDAGRSSLQLEAAAYNEGGGVIEGAVFEWSTSDDGVVAVGAAGRVTAVASGEAVVRASVGDVVGETGVRVSLRSGYFVCGCASGADGDCEAGDDGATGRSPYSALAGYQAARGRFGALAAGDTIRFCAGGVVAVDGDRGWVNDACRADSPCVVGSYAAPWSSGDEARPVLRAAAGHVFYLSNAGNARHQEGYAFRDLSLRCTGCVDTDWAFLLYNDIDDVTIEDVEMDGFGIGVHASESNPCGADPECDGRNSRLVIRGARIVHSLSQGFLGASDGLVIEDSYFEDNGTRAILDHNIYIGGSSAGARVSRNELYRSALTDAGECSGVSLVVHGVHSDLVIEDNLVREDPGKALPGCWGIAVDPAYADAERFERVVIRRNRVHNVGNLGIGVASCVDCVIENNVVVNGQDFAAIGIAAPDRSPGEGDAAMTGVVVRNNSVYIAGPGGAGITMGGLGAGNALVSNAIHYAGTSAEWYCLEVVVPDGPAPGEVYDDVGHNICWAPALGDAVRWERYTGTDPDPLTAWRNAHGFGDGSQLADPGFLDPSVFDLRAVSGDAAMVDAGHPTLSAPTDIDGVERGVADVGAHERGG